MFLENFMDILKHKEYLYEINNKLEKIVSKIDDREYLVQDKIEEILAQKFRTSAGPTAPPYGLYLEKISY